MIVSELNMSLIFNYVSTFVKLDLLIKTFRFQGIFLVKSTNSNRHFSSKKRDNAPLNMTLS